MKGGRTQNCDGLVGCQNVWDDGQGICNTKIGCPTLGMGWYKRSVGLFDRNKPLRNVLLEGQDEEWNMYQSLVNLKKGVQRMEWNDLICPVCDLIINKKNSVYYHQLTLEEADDKYVAPVNRSKRADAPVNRSKRSVLDLTLEAANSPEILTLEPVGAPEDSASKYWK